MIPELLKIANTLDKKGFYKEASIIDSLIKCAIEEPACECDMQLSGMHDPECEWLKWKSSGKPEAKVPKDTKLRKYLYGFKSDLELIGAKLVSLNSYNANVLKIEYKMRDEDDASEFDQEFRWSIISDEVLGNILVLGGVASDYTNIKLTLEAPHMPQGKNLADHVKDIFDEL